jgi:hypothetical protein
MPDARRKRGQRATTRRRLAIIGIAAFLLVDLGLVAVAVTREPSGLAADAETPAATSTPSTPTPEPVETPVATPTAAPDAVPTSRLLSAVDGDTAWRSEAGTCTPGSDPTPTTLEATTTGGDSWTPSTVTTPGLVAGVDRLQATDASTAFVVGPAGTSCETAFAQTFSAGAAFRDYPDRLAGAWHVARSDRAVVHSPIGDQVAPCPVVVDLAVVSDTQAAVLCADHTLYRTDDGAASWDGGTTVDGAVAVSAEVGTVYVASADAPDCAGTQISSSPATDDAPVTPVGCASATSDQPGTVALSATAGAVWLWAGETVLVSRDGGSTW